MKMKKFIAALLAFVIVCSAGIMPAAASTKKTRSVSGDEYFTGKWEVTIVYKIQGTSTAVGELTYGFDTYLTDEDYAWAKAYECNVQAGVRRVGEDSAAVYASEKTKNKYSKCELKHKTTYVKYVILFSATYSTLTPASKAETNIK